MSKWASGRRSKSICERSGFKFNYKEMVHEPGTNYWVHWTESDGKWSLANHPQNRYADLSENIALRWSRPDRDETAFDETFITTEDGQNIIWENVDMVGDYAIYAQVSADVAGT